MLHRIISTREFALVDLLLVFLSGCLWILIPEIGILPLLTIALIPWVIRLLAGSFPFRRTSLDWFVLLFLGTAWLGYWSAYNQETAWIKVWLIFLAVLLYYALASQPVENFEWVCIFFFCIGVGVSIYFFLTLDIGPGPLVAWSPIHQNYAAGIAAITTPFILYPIRQSAGKSSFAFLRVFAILGLGIAWLAILAASSRGIILAIASAGGIWILWWILNRNQWTWLRHTVTFPSLALIYLSVVVLFLYLGPANSGYISIDYPYGTGSRAELFARSIYLVLDVPFTGGGFGSFPGLYSYYMLGIPFFNVINSHNLFLDVAIEQGILGGFSFLFIFLASIWFVAKNIAEAYSRQTQLLGWLTLATLITAFVHGLVDDYLYNGNGTLFALALTGFSSALHPKVARLTQPRNYLIPSSVALILAVFTMANLSGLRAAWYANVGAVQMARVELNGFPTNQWTDPSILPEVEQAEVALRYAFEVDPVNHTANHRLGLISMLRGDFVSAAVSLERAHKEAPHHRGIIKSLGYCYVWLGNTERAFALLHQIPETKDELETYVWWWGERGRPDLAERASRFLSYLERLSAQ